MNRRLLIPALATCLLATGSANLRADDEAQPPPDPSTATCPTYPAVSCTSTDTLACSETLQLAIDARNALGPVLLLGQNWRFPVHIRIVTTDDPLAAKVTQESVSVVPDNDTMRIEAILPSYDPNAREFIQRQFVRAMLWEKFFASTKKFDTAPRLEVVPVWLLEGLRETLNEDPGHDRESIVRKAVQAQRAPPLDEVTSWQELSDDRLLGLWQRSFCFYLVDSLIRSGPQRVGFQQWLTTLSGPNPTSAQVLFPTEAGWQGELDSAMQRSRDIVYSWDETMAELSSAEVIAIDADKPSETRICTLDTVSNFPMGPKLVAALQKKIYDLTALELRAHASWHPILDLYCSGLTALVADPDNGKKLIRQAHDLRVAEMAHHQKLVDYVNWFEVTKDFSSNTSHFQSYFYTATEMERVQADPDHPNPIRASLLQLESQF